MSTRLFVGNLPDSVVEHDLRSAFSNFGEITNLDLKCKPSSDESKEQKKFAFITLSGSNYNIESCINHFTSKDFNGSRLYVTRARESFLERLQREREQTQKKEINKEQQSEISPKKYPVLKVGDKLNPHKRKLSTSTTCEKVHNENIVIKAFDEKNITETHFRNGDSVKNEVKFILTEKDKKKIDSEKKRLESIKQKRREFKAKQMIIKNGLTGVDKIQNKKVIFSDNEEENQGSQNEVQNTRIQRNKNILFDDTESDNEVNFEIKKQFEGKQGLKVLDLQSKYKSDKRFVLDERFIEDTPDDQIQQKDNEEVEIGPTDEKMKQLNILQDLLGVAIKTSSNKDYDGKKAKPKMGMLRFDPSHPDHAKFLIPKEEVHQNKTKKVQNGPKEKIVEKNEEVPVFTVEKVEVSKEQFYKVSETLKDAIGQPKTFSLRSLFPTNERSEQDLQQQETDYISLEKSKQQRVKNPLNPGEKNPFVYDSSDSENDEDSKEDNKVLPILETKAVWKENFFFSQDDNRLKDGLAFFNKTSTREVHKERRELKSLVKKRIYNNERKNQMFQKKIGGRKKSVKKSFRKKN